MDSKKVHLQSWFCHCASIYGSVAPLDFIATLEPNFKNEWAKMAVQCAVRGDAAKS